MAADSAAAAIAGVTPRRPFVTASIVASQPGHQLLGRCVIDTVDIVEKLVRTTTSQHRRRAAMVRDHDIAVLASRPVEAVRCRHQFAPGVGTGVVSMRYTRAAVSWKIAFRSSSV